MHKVMMFLCFIVSGCTNVVVHDLHTEDFIQKSNAFVPSAMHEDMTEKLLKTVDAYEGFRRLYFKSQVYNHVLETKIERLEKNLYDMKEENEWLRKKALVNWGELPGLTPMGIKE